MKVKDQLPSSMHSSCIVYHVPCNCGKLYISDTVRRLEMIIKEHKDACKKRAIE